MEQKGVSKDFLQTFGGEKGVRKDFLQTFGGDIYKFLIKNVFLMTLMKPILGFFVTDLSQRFGIHLLTVTIKYFIHG